MFFGSACGWYLPLFPIPKIQPSSDSMDIIRDPALVTVMKAIKTASKFERSPLPNCCPLLSCATVTVHDPLAFLVIPLNCLIFASAATAGIQCSLCRSGLNVMLENDCGEGSSRVDG